MWPTKLSMCAKSRCFFTLSPLCAEYNESLPSRSWISIQKPQIFSLLVSHEEHEYYSGGSMWPVSRFGTLEQRGHPACSRSLCLIRNGHRLGIPSPEHSCLRLHQHLQSKVHHVRLLWTKWYSGALNFLGIKTKMPGRQAVALYLCEPSCNAVIRQEPWARKVSQWCGVLGWEALHRGLGASGQARSLHMITEVPWPPLGSAEEVL